MIKVLWMFENDLLFERLKIFLNYPFIIYLLNWVTNLSFLPSASHLSFTLKCNRRYFVCEKYLSDSEYMYNWVWNKLLWDINSFHNFSFEIASGHWTGWAQASRSLFQGPEKRLSQITFTCLLTKINHERSQQKIIICLCAEKWGWVFTETPPDAAWGDVRRPSPLTIIKLNTLTSAISARVTGSFTRSP